MSFSLTDRNGYIINAITSGVRRYKALRKAKNFLSRRETLHYEGLGKK